MVLEVLPVDMITEVCKHLHMSDVSSMYYTSSSLKKKIKDNQKYIYSICQTNQPHGIVKEWWDKEKTFLKSETLYSNGKEDGPSKSFSTSGGILMHGFYSKGLMDGEWKEWYNDGNLYERRFYRDDNLEGVYESWYQNGLLRYEDCYKNGRRHGHSKDWYNSGVLSRHEVYENGKKYMIIV